MSVAIICLANGPYSIFIDNLIESCEKNLLKNRKKEYFIITDSDFSYQNYYNVTKIYKKRNGWPLDCLLRPQYSHELYNLTNHLEYVYFFNANMSIYSEITDDILPNESGLVGVEHACYTHRNNLVFTYDRNPYTNAYIPMGLGTIYYQACLWGGTHSRFMEMSKTIQNWANEDLKNKVQPIWLDESYLNKYFITYPPKLLPITYAYPTHFPYYDDMSKLKIIQLQKNDYILDENFRYL